MKIMRTLRFFCAAALLLLGSGGVFAQNKEVTTIADTTKTVPFRGVQYASREEAAAALARNKRIPFLAGASLTADLCGAVMAVATPYGQYEAALRVNLRGRYFPVVEAGWGVSDHTNDITDINYKVSAPYFRLGCDYNFTKDKRSSGRILAGLRYGFSVFDYDLAAPPVQDPNYGGSLPVSLKGISGCVHWAEVVFGLEAKVWGPLSLGWSVRYRLRLSDKKSAFGSPWYVPGFGKNGTTTLGGTFNIGFTI